MRIVLIYMLAIGLGFGIGLLLKGRADSGAEVRVESKSAREQSVLVEKRKNLRRAMRTGDAADLVRSLERESLRDPVAFFELLVGIPYFNELNELVAETAGRVDQDRHDVVTLLNGLRSSDWRSAAWKGFISAHAGAIPAEKMLEYAGAISSRHKMHVYRALFEEEARQRPEEFVQALYERPGDELLREYFHEVMKADFELGVRLFAEMPGGFKRFEDERKAIFEKMVETQPTAQTLVRAWELMGENGQRQGNGLRVAELAFKHADPTERSRMVDEIVKFPTVDRNRLFRMIGSRAPLADLPRILTSMTSRPMGRQLIHAKFTHAPAQDILAVLPAGPWREYALHLDDQRASVVRDPNGPPAPAPAPEP